MRTTCIHTAYRYPLLPRWARRSPSLPCSLFHAGNRRNSKFSEPLWLKSAEKLWFDPMVCVPTRCFLVGGDPEQDVTRLLWSFVPPCRYGWNCWRPGCVFESARSTSKTWRSSGLRQLGLLGSQSTGPRQNPKSQCLQVWLGLLGPERRTRPMPTLQQSQGLLMNLGLLESQRRVPRQNLNSRRVPVELGLLGPEDMS